MLFERTPVEDVPVEDVPETPKGRDARIAAIKALVTKVHEAHPGTVLDRTVEGSIAHEAAVRELGAAVRELAVEEAGDVAVDAPALNDLRAAKKAVMDEHWGLKPGDFATGGARADEVPEGKTYWDVYKAKKVALEKEWKRIGQEIKRIEMAPREARGRAALDILREVREMGVDPKTIGFESGSSTEAKALVKEMSEWYPKDWWELSNGRGKPIQAKIVKGRAFYSDSYLEKKQGAYRTVSRLVTGSGDRSTTVHELGHRMEASTDDLTRLELRFWRRRTDDGKGFGGLRRYKHGRADEIVNPDEFGDEYMGKSYWGARHKDLERDGVGYSKASLDRLEVGSMGKPTSAEVFTMGMEEVTFNNYGSWDKDLDYIDFVLGVLAGV